MQDQGKIKALYSGRFAYILSKDKHTAENDFKEILRKDNIKNRLSNTDEFHIENKHSLKENAAGEGGIYPRIRYKQQLLEKFNHFKFYFESFSMLYINGIMWIFAYIISNDKRAVENNFEEIIREENVKNKVIQTDELNIDNKFFSKGNVSDEEGLDPRIRNKQQLLEEFNHFKLYSKSISALYINGIRWIVRFIFIFTNNYRIVYEYYKARAIFFGMSYSFHENSVNKKIIDYINLIRLDNEIIFHSLKNSSIYRLLFLFFPLIVLIGFVITKHFSIRIVDSSCKEISKKMVVISKYGYVRYEDGMIPSTFAQKFGGIIQLEHWGLAHKKQEFWLIAKFAAEKDMWSLYPSKFKFADKCTYFDYVHKIISFIDEWYYGTGINRKCLKELFLNPTMQNYEQLKNKLDGISYYTFFIYQHGN
ncbi:MAG: hypothetical protein ACTFAK_13970 [Candidatus Electronema sp. VV]